jgi:hypothetical protein
LLKQGKKSKKEEAWSTETNHEETCC